MASHAKAVPLALGLLTLAVGMPSASSQSFPAPTDRNHTIDIHVGSAIGSPKIVGMGGTATATAQGSAGMLSNPASPGVRPTTSNSTWDWDWHLDSHSPALGSDDDNNGIATDDIAYSPNVTYGLAVQYKDWGLGITGIVQRTEATLANTDLLATEASVTKFAFSHYMLDTQLVVGVGARAVLLTVTSASAGGPEQTLLELSGAGLEAGVVWKPNRRSVRAGATFSVPVISDSDMTIENCDPLDCVGYVLPNKIKVPWQASIGLASRHAPTEWNQKVMSNWRDEKALLWAADIVVTGKTKNGIGLEAFGQRMLQPSGRTVDVSVRAGVEYEWFPGRLRLRAGSYYEPSRFRDPEGDDIPGRAHLTTGFDWRFWSLEVWETPYRLQLAFTADVARNFGNTGLSVGFWH